MYKSKTRWAELQQKAVACSIAADTGVIALLHCWNVMAAFIPGGLFHQPINANAPLSAPKHQNILWHNKSVNDTHLRGDVITYQALST